MLKLTFHDIHLTTLPRSPGSKKDDEAMYETGASGKLTGEGSHFGTGGTGTDSAGYSLGKDTEGHGFSAAEPTGNTDSSGYAIGKGPEALGTREEGNHINTAATASALDESDGTGQAAVGQTSTYSSHPLATGDKTSSVIDPSSSDANTFKRPEVSSTAGVGPGAAEAAARKAYDHSSEHMPGEYPTEESSNPYVASHIDPRVDSAGHAPTQQSHIGRDAALGAGAGAAGVGAYEATKTHEPTSSTTTAPTALTSTTDSTERSPAYGSASESRGLDSTTPATGSSYTPASTSTPATATADDSTQRKGVVGTVLGALGLGGGAAAAKHEHDKDSAVDSTPSTTTGIGSYRTPSQSGPPPSHHRKESIPTTAYPSGTLDSVRPISGPTGKAPTQGASDSHLGRDAAIGAGAVGAAGLGAHEYEKSREPTGGAGQTTFASGMAGTSAAAPNTSTVHDVVTGDTPQTSQSTARTSGPGTGLAATAGTTGAVVPDAASSNTRTAAGDDTHHYGRDAAIGGGALGAAGLGAREYEKSREPAAATSGVTSTSQHYGNQPITSQATEDFSKKVDPRTDAAGNANRGTGVGAVPTTTSDQPEEQHHYGRDAALVGGGAAAAGYGAHEYSEHDAEKAEKGRNKLQKQQTKEMEKDEKAHEKEIKKEQKAEEKAEKKHEKELAKEEKKHEKELAKEEKELAKEEKKHDKLVAKEEKQQEKALEKDEKRHEKEGAAAVGAGAVGAGGAYEYEKHHEPSTGTSGGGLAAADAGDRQAYSTSAAADPTVTGQHDGRDAAVGGAGAAAVGAGAYEAEKSHPGPTGTGGLAAADAADREAYNKQNRYTTALADPGADPTVQKPSIAAGEGTTTGTHGTDPYYNRHQVPDSAIAGQETGSNVATDSQHHYGRDAAVGGAGAAAVGGGAYEAEKHQHEHSATGAGNRHSGLAAADEDDRRVYGKDEREKKPSLFRRIFKRKKNTHTGESEDDEENYEDVPHDHPDSTLNQGLTSGTVPAGSPATSHTHPHEEGEFTKPSYNPFKKEDPNVKPVEGRL